MDALELRAEMDQNLYRVYVLGEYGTLEGLIFKEGEHWNKCSSMPDPFKRNLFVLDFGFTQNPTAILDIRYRDGKYWIDELLHKPGMHNIEIYKFLSLLAKRSEVIADSAEPKSISELRRLGLNINPSQKGPDSVKFSISTLQSTQMMITNQYNQRIPQLLLPEREAWGIYREARGSLEPLYRCYPLWNQRYHNIRITLIP